MDNENVSTKKITLSNGLEMPAIGIGTFRVRSQAAAYKFVDKALDAGYRLFDTAAMFGNETSLRYAFNSLLPKYDLDRSDIFITSKLVTINKPDYANVKRLFEKSLTNMGLDYFDLYLVNYPSGSETNRKMTWAALQSLYDEGCVSAIGVSNYKVHHLQQVTTKYSAPMVNQIEWNPLIHDNELYSYCQRNDILIQAHSPFGTPFSSDKKLFYNPVIKKLASKHKALPSQVILMWSLQKNVAVLPLTTNRLHMRQNINMRLRLTEREVNMIDEIAPYSSSHSKLCALVSRSCI